MPIFIDLTGKRFSRLFIIRRGPDANDRQARWHALCDCGNETLVGSRNVRSGMTKSCGCPKRELTSTRTRKILPIGTKFGLLTIVGIAPSRGEKGYFRTVCDCGKETVKSLLTLQGGYSKSCGAGCPIRFPDAAKNLVLSRYKMGARNRHLVWELSDKEFFWIATQNCHYCGVLPSLTEQPRVKGAPTFTYSGVDRKDSTLGYIEGNCLPCCTECNRAKMQRSYNDFLKWIARVANHIIKTKKSWAA